MRVEGIRNADRATVTMSFDEWSAECVAPAIAVVNIEDAAPVVSADDDTTADDAPTDRWTWVVATLLALAGVLALRRCRHRRDAVGDST